MLATGVVIVLWLGFYLWYFLTYNHLVALRNTVGQSWAHVDVELQRRFDLIGNLVQVVKGYARHEADTLVNVAAARNPHPAGAREATAQSRQDAALLGQAMVLVERYPALKADAQFTTLQQALIDTENRIATRRNAYNECVSRFEIYRQTFPPNLITWAGHFSGAEFFDADAASAQAIRVVLS